VVARLTRTSYDPVLKFPSGGDTSYAGHVWHDGLPWVSYYASHEGKTVDGQACGLLPDQFLNCHIGRGHRVTNAVEIEVDTDYEAGCGFLGQFRERVVQVAGNRRLLSDPFLRPLPVWHRRSVQGELLQVRAQPQREFHV
jgi:hypothetical protein